MQAEVIVYGAGRLGQTLAHLWQRTQGLAILSVHNRSLASARQACEFIGAGEAHLASELPPVPEAAQHLPQLLMLSVPDAEIATLAASLAQRLPTPAPGSIAFHCSGSLPSSLLDPLRRAGYAVASIHPVKSFADPAMAAASFAGTWCALEGDPEATTRLAPLLTAIGANCFAVASEAKSIYHAGSVFASNCVVGLLEAALRCFALAGIPPAVATGILLPIAQGTLANVQHLGTTQALTGPIARGEAEVVARQLAALGKEQPALAEVYRSVGLLLLELATAQATATPEALSQIATTLAASRAAIPG